MRLLDWKNQDLTDFPWKMEDIETKADTFIEWCFEQKLYGIQKGADILNEWKIRKREYESYIAATVFDFQHYSQHDASHSINILNAIELVLGRKRVKELSASDLWLLLECAYFHDTGMALSNEEIRELWTGNDEFKSFLYTALETNDFDKKQAALYYKQMNDLLAGRKLSEPKIEFPLDWPVEMEKNITLLTGEFIRKNHPQKARKNMDRRIGENESRKINNLIGKRLNILVGKVSELHGGEYADIRKNLKYKELGFGTDYLHPQFAAVMLRLGDLLDIDNNRFNVRAIEHFGKLPVLSETHYKKHKALTNFCIEEQQIMAESFSDSEEVCRVTGEWFQWLDSEVNNIICDWNTFVPQKLKGCILNRCQLKIYFQDKPFEMKLQKNFEVDKQRLINLMVGSNIYDSGLDCFREYIQNAFDACKMMLWHEMKNGRTKRDKLQEITPFDIDNKMYEELAVEIRVTVREQKVYFKIRDFGVGMEEECVNNLSVIGRSWKNRSLYQKAAVEMPAWLKPTGGFGIGLQSAFMLTDQVKIMTRSVQEIKSHKLILDSPARKGTVTRSEEGDVPVGTEITFEVSLNKMAGMIKEVSELKLDRHTELNLTFEKKCEDGFRKENITDYIIRFLKYYIARTFPDTLFPIQLYEGDRKVYTHRSLFADEKREGFGPCKFKRIKKDNEEYRYHISENMTVRIWDVKDNSFVCIKSWPSQIPGAGTMAPTLLNTFCYKGARVEKLREEDRNYSFYDFLAVCIDILGLNMSEVMALERNSFAQDFDVIAYYRKYVKIYLEIVYEEQIKSKINLDKIQENLNLFLYVLAAIQLMEKNRVIAVMEQCSSNLQTPENIIVKEIKDNSIEKSRMETSAVLKELRNIFERKVPGEAEKKEVVFLAIKEEDYERIIAATGRKSNKEKLTQVALSNLLEEENNDGLLPEEMEIPRKIAHYMEKGIRIYMNNDITNALIWLGYKFDMSFFRLKEDDECIYAMIVGFNGDWDYSDQVIVEKDTFLKKAFQWNRVRYIGKNISCPEYDNLRVDALPMQNSSKWFGKRKEHYLISPISNAVYLEILKAADIQQDELKGTAKITMKRFISPDRFEEIVTGAEEYDFLISWVKEHQAESEKLDMEEIRNLYQTMIRDIYDQNLQE